MSSMQKPTQSEKASQDQAGARQAWSRPELVAYGHLAKLTRGPSGNMTEAGGLKKCL